MSHHLKASLAAIDLWEAALLRRDYTATHIYARFIDNHWPMIQLRTSK
jgi:hypothetical protein